MKTRVLQLTKSLLFARRNSKIKQEQKAYDKLLMFCQDNGINFNNALEGATKQIRSTISGQMNGL